MRQKEVLPKTLRATLLTQGIIASGCNQEVFSPHRIMNLLGSRLLLLDLELLACVHAVDGCGIAFLCSAIFISVVVLLLHDILVYDRSVRMRVCIAGARNFLELPGHDLPQFKYEQLDLKRSSDFDFRLGDWL